MTVVCATRIHRPYVQAIRNHLEIAADLDGIRAEKWRIEWWVKWGKPAFSLAACNDW